MAERRFNVVLEKIKRKQLDPTVACVAGACQRFSQIILQLNG